MGLVAAHRLPSMQGLGAQTGLGIGDQREAVCQVIARTAVEPHTVTVLAGDDPKPSCLISWTHRSPEGGLPVLVGRHGQTNPAERIRDMPAAPSP